MYRLRSFNPVNNRNYVPRLESSDTEILTYSQKDDGMEPEIFQGQIVLVLKRNYIFNEKDIYLILCPYGEQIRRLKMISSESVKLVASNKKCNNEIFLIEDIQILGKVKIS
jgi:phage repressor protein C with HTH and peptisase S24 domain